MNLRLVSCTVAYKCLWFTFFQLRKDKIVFFMTTIRTKYIDVKSNIHHNALLKVYSRRQGTVDQ